MATLDLSGIRDILRTQPEAKKRLLDAAAEAIVTDVKTSFNTSPPGRAYRRRTVTHVASRDGYPPNVDTGALRASIRMIRDGDSKRIIQDGVEYGIYLETGTRRMAARPFMTPAFWRMANRFPEFARRVLNIEGRA